MEREFSNKTKLTWWWISVVKEREWDFREIISFMEWANEFVLMCFLRCRIIKEDKDWRENHVLDGNDGKMRTPMLEEQDYCVFLKALQCADIELSANLVLPKVCYPPSTPSKADGTLRLKYQWGLKLIIIC